MGDGVKNLFSTYSTPLLVSVDMVFDDYTSTVKFAIKGKNLIPTFAVFQLYSWDTVEQAKVDVVELNDYHPGESSITEYYTSLGNEWPAIMKV
jgi:hypothetical protein